jgi:hypothetical protein
MNNMLTSKQCPLLLLLLLVCPVLLWAQEAEVSSHGLYTIKEYHVGDTLTVFSDTAYVRDAASTRGQLVGQLPAGAKVVFLRDAGNPQTIKGFTTPWVYARFQQNGVAREGYLWKGLLAVASFSCKEHRFLYGFDHVTVTGNPGESIPDYFIKLKAVDQQNKLVAVKAWKLGSGESSGYSEGKLLGNMGLEGISEIIRICFSGEACGIPTEYTYFGWTGSELLSLPGKTQISDAGVFYHTETLLFPKEEGGQAGKIIKLVEDAESTDKVDKNGEPVMTITRRSESYTWDGKKATKQ